MTFNFYLKLHFCFHDLREEKESLLDSSSKKKKS